MENHKYQNILFQLDIKNLHLNPEIEKLLLDKLDNFLNSGLLFKRNDYDEGYDEGYKIGLADSHDCDCNY